MESSTINSEIVSGNPGQEYSNTQPGSGNLSSGSGNSSDETSTFGDKTTIGLRRPIRHKNNWTDNLETQTGIPEIEYTDIEADNRSSEDIGSGTNRRYISSEKKLVKSGSPSDNTVVLGTNLRGAASFSSNSGSAIGAWPSNEMTVKVTPMEILLPVFLFFLLSFFVALVAAIYRLVYTMIIKFRLTQRFRRSARNNFRNMHESSNSGGNMPYMEEPPSYISLYPELANAGYSRPNLQPVANSPSAAVDPEEIEMRPSCCSPINVDSVFINLGAENTDKTVKKEENRKKRNNTL